MYGLPSVELMEHAIQIVCCFVTTVTAVFGYMLTMRF